jgi:biopolymer transport protein ExbB/biopolymer transport protein TolQ
MDIVDSLYKVALLGSSWVLWLLIALSVVSITAMVERIVFFARNGLGSDALSRDLRRALADGDEAGVNRTLATNRSIEAGVLREAIRWKRGGPDAVTDAIESELGRKRKELERGSTFLGTLGNNAPFVGLFGTVLGVIAAFDSLAGGPGDAAMDNVMAGIAEALVATGVGIVVAIPAVVAYNLVQKRIADIEDGARALGRLLVAWIRTDGRGAEQPVSTEAKADAPASEDRAAFTALADGAE